MISNGDQMVICFKPEDDVSVLIVLQNNKTKCCCFSNIKKMYE